MTWVLLQALILGIVEGLTEFIPVSSTGHLIVVGHLIGFTGESAAPFTVFIQLGAILAVVWETRVSLIRFARDLRWGGSGMKMAVNLALAFAPSAIIGLAIHDFIEETLFSPIYVAWGLIAGAVGILIIEGVKRKGGLSSAKGAGADGEVRVEGKRGVEKAGGTGQLVDDRSAESGSPHSPDAAGEDGAIHGLEAIPGRSALAVGFAQCLSLFPGISRSAATIMGGMVAGMDRKTATEFSFLLAIPTMFGASFLDLWKWRDVLTIADAPTFAVGFVTSFIFGLLSVRFLLRYVSRHDFRPFAWYRIAVAAAVLWMFGTG